MDVRLEGFTKRFGATTVIADLDLEVRSGEMLALLGPSGCGKSTTLFALCGLYRLDAGRLWFGAEEVTRLSPQRRQVGVVFQSYALYPHMTVFENIAFPLEVAGVAKAEVRRRVGEVAELVRIDELGARLPADLSGGQQQRVAVARALVRRPRVLLLDEPLANLDAKLRLEMRGEIRRIQRETGTTAVVVTHDQVEAMSMSDRIAIMDRGVIRQIAAPQEMYARPTDRFVADFLGNPPIAFVDGVARAGRFHGPAGTALDLPGGFADAGERPVTLGLRPEHLSPDPAGAIEARITHVEAHGRETLVALALADGTRLRAVLPVRDDLAPVERRRWRVDTRRLLVFDADGRRLDPAPARPAPVE